MGFYSQKILPRLLDFVLSNPQYSEYRKEVLSEVYGDVLEIGFGTGLNLPHYPDRIKKITTIDVNAGMNSLAQKRIQAASITNEKTPHWGLLNRQSVEP